MEKTTYAFSSTGGTREIIQHITSNSTNLTNMIEYKKNIRHNTSAKLNARSENADMQLATHVTPILKQVYHSLAKMELITLTRVFILFYLFYFILLHFILLYFIVLYFIYYYWCRHAIA